MDQLLPTGKKHVSYSEMTDWLMCPFRHKLIHIENVIPRKEHPAFVMGKVVHSACEGFLNTKNMDTSTIEASFEKAWEENKELEVFIKSRSTIPKLVKTATSILTDVPVFFDKQFPGWEPIGAEEQLYESVADENDYMFKGFIDAIITAPGKRDKTEFWILDFKTCRWGWPMEKKRDENVRLQLMLYKTYWAKKHDVPMKDIKAGFVLLKKDAKPGNHCELVPVSVGDVTSTRAVQHVKNMTSSLKKGLAFKNRTSCDHCDLKGTIHCP